MGSAEVLLASSDEGSIVCASTYGRVLAETAFLNSRSSLRYFTSNDIGK
eukprot:CAMPEP_0170484380 /NCGR_PEP_ID=MMETSP0208-20121228/3866_1 /TAXON_ID=197538 /ORGANISM="Strombidium inclinatum, Strain S3" /LENGTH=48 /DNA_ID= /DNA_START= /DNA_END= /DNA_ORIENTATION=